MLLLDLLLPTMDGARFRAAQLRDRLLAWIPVVLMSGGVEAAEKARAFGARGFLRKPLDLDQVRTTLRSVGCYHLTPARTCAGRRDSGLIRRLSACAAELALLFGAPLPSQ